MFCLFSCSEPTKVVDDLGKEQLNEIFEFRGEKVLIPMNFPKELFDQTQEEFDLYYEKVSNNDNSRNLDNITRLSYHDLKIILNKHISSIPNINTEDEISQSDLKIIFKDFPTITTAEEANEKKSLIFDYYQTLIKPNVINDVIDFENNGNSNLRVLGGSPNTLTDPERNHLLSNPGFAVHYADAANDAIDFSGIHFGNDNGDNMANSFTHSIWNALSIRYILKRTPASKTQAIDFTQDGTSKHEMDNSGNQIHDISAAMDLHNNMSARVWMEQETSWGIGPFRSVPEVNDIINEMYAKAQIAIFFNSTVDPTGAYSLVLAAHGGNNTTTWNNLYNNLYGPFQHLVYVN